MNNFNFDLDNNIDEDFFDSLTGSKSSKLQQLFGEETLSADDKQQTLKYQRPKANELKNNESKDVAATTTNNTSTTLMAKVVTAYKQGELQGKVGLALIQNVDNTFNIIMYKTKNYILVTLKLIAGEDLLYKQTKYWQFYDEAAIYWSFSFENPIDEVEFMEKLNEKRITFEQPEKEDHTQKPLDLDNETEFLIDKEELLENLHKTAIKDSKNSLIKRVAKMGKPLPTLSSYGQQTTTEFSDSSDTEVIKTPLASMAKPVIAPRSNKLNSSKVNSQVMTTMAAFNPTSTAGAIFPIAPMESQYMQMLLTEQRTQGSELRMNMNKLENKIEKVLDKLELYDRTDAKTKPEKDDEILELEEKLLMLKKENRKLKQNLQEQNSIAKEERTKEIINEIKEDLKELEIDYKQDLKIIITQLKAKLKENLRKVQELQENLAESEFALKEKQTELNTKEKAITEMESQLNLLRRQENDFKVKENEQELQILKLKQKLLDLQTKLQEKTQTSLTTPNDSLVKTIMNNLYVDIAEKLEHNNLPQNEQTLAIIAASIRQQTLKSLQQLKTKE
ncbi:uncharacterized protein ACRADG_008671 isoform 1-T2 [Cochliomyia hominivorax]